jgi:Protein of unknown function (DUF3048) N-terminal domain/Protein of unknown function (DUF3048) C-terminal domain
MRLMSWLRRWTHRKTIAVASSAVAAAAVGIGVSLAVGGGGQPPAHHPPQRPTPTPAPAQSVATGPLMSPFTGEPVRSLGPVLAVKIDNIVYARPQTGLTRADIVYVLPVEGGLSRFLAIFSSHIPPVVGPVRSARQDDLEVLRQFGRPAFAYSGAQTRLLKVVEHAHIVDLYAGLVSGYYRDYQRIAPYNLYGDTKTLLREAKGASKAHNIGFKFGPAPAGGRRTARESVSYPSASFTFTWSGSKKRWLIWTDGSRAGSTEGPQLSAATVVLQHTVVRTSGFLEADRRPPYAETVGHGTAVVLRNGKAYKVKWSRPTADGGTTFTTLSGQPMTFAPGQVWIVLWGNRVAESG